MGYTPPPNPSPFNQNFTGALFLDIETAPKHPVFKDLDEHTQTVFKKKFREELANIGSPTDAFLQSLWTSKAPLHAEYNQIVCVSVGRFGVNEEGKTVLKVKAFTSPDEIKLLLEIAKVIGKQETVFLVAHNGLNFDYPMLVRKYMMHGLPIPSMLQIVGKKPWDILLFDTVEMWKLTEYRGNISLDALAMAMGVESPKGDVTGADVGRLFWIMQDLEAIGTYCNGDVVCLAKCYIKMINAPMFETVVIVA